MNTRILALAIAGSAIGLTGCVTDGYGGYGYSSVGWGSPYAYDGWYDGYYGSIYDGYWGGDDYFYYRSSPQDRSFRRADRDHFRRVAPQGDHRFTRHRGEFRPQQGMAMPQWRGGEGVRNNDRDRDRDRGQRGRDGRPQRDGRQPR